MQSFPIYTDSQVSWRLFASDNSCTSWCDVYSPICISAVLAEVRKIFVNTFGPETVNAHPLLSVLYSDEGPVCFRKQRLIFLSSQGDDYNRHIYQFAHELCHFMVSGDTRPEYQWLNETLCVMMSWYTMRCIHQKRETSPCCILKPSYSGMERYISDDMADRDNLLDGATVPEYIRKNLEYLHKNSNDYRKCRTIAYEIYPVFCNYPELWKIVPFLDQLTSDMTLDLALDALTKSASLPPVVGNLLHQRLLCE